MDKPSSRLSPGYRHIKSIYNELGSHMLRHTPADDPAATAIQNEREIQPSLSGRNISEVRHPQPIGRVGDEAALHQVGSSLGGLILMGGAHILLPVAASLVPQASSAGLPGCVEAACRLRSSAYTLGYPYVPRLSSWILLILSVIPASAAALAETPLVLQA